MTTRTMRDLGAIAQRQWGLVTTKQAHAAGVARLQLSRLAGGGALERVSQGIYRLAGAPALENEQILASWVALDGKDFDPARQPAAVVAGVAAARVHEIGDFWIETIDFFTPIRRVSRRPDVRTRVRTLARGEYTLVDGLPTLTGARTIADLVELWTDESLVADALRDGIDRGIVDLRHLSDHLAPLAGAHGFHDGDGASFVGRLLDIARRGNR